MYRFTEKNTFRVIVIDQSRQGVYDKIKDRVHLHIRSYRNLGFAKAMNTGIALADTPYITLANDDVEFINSRWWQGVLDGFEEIPNALAVNPASIADRNEQPRIPYKQEYSEQEYQSLIDSTYGQGTCYIDGICMWFTVVPRETFKKIGLLDERFYPGGGEDYDFNARIYQAGGRAVGTYKSWLWHHWGMSKDRLEEADKEGLGIDRKKNWNDLNSLWSGKFDIYNPGAPRDLLVAVDPL